MGVTTHWRVSVAGRFPDPTHDLVGDEGCDVCGAPLELSEGGMRLYADGGRIDMWFCEWECLAHHAAGVIAATFEDDDEVREDAARASITVETWDDP